MVIRMSEIFLDVPESLRRDEPARERLLPLIKRNNEIKWLNLDEFLKLLKVLGVNPDETFYDYICEYLEGNSDYLTAQESVKDEFVKFDLNLDGSISKVFIVEIGRTLNTTDCEFNSKTLTFVCRENSLQHCTAIGRITIQMPESTIVLLDLIEIRMEK
jgi:hypothetical protein